MIGVAPSDRSYPIPDCKDKEHTMHVFYQGNSPEAKKKRRLLSPEKKLSLDGKPTSKSSVC
jgi:hypothetical protein